NIPNINHIPNNTTIKHTLPNIFNNNNNITLNLHKNNFTTISHIITTLNNTFNNNTTHTINNITISIQSPNNPNTHINL
ncbi:flagellar biosynthesis protein FlgI, partial [Escherichia coli]|nr:flagellar biosynthesis protein FlgI [Escherichia coli]